MNASEKEKINKYLAIENGLAFENPKPEIGENSPYQLQYFGNIETSKWGPLSVYTYQGSQEHFAFTGRLTGTMPLEGKSLQHIQQLFDGEEWLEREGAPFSPHSVISKHYVSPEAARELELVLARQGTSATELPSAIEAAAYIERLGTYIILCQKGGFPHIFIPGGASVTLPIRSSNEWSMLTIGVAQLLSQGAI